MKKLFTLLFLVSITCSSWAQDQTIDISGLSFTPANVTISVGQTVEWTNNSGIGHNVNGTQAAYPNNPEDFGNAVSAMNWTFSHTFNTVGTYDYHCDPHLGAGMTGVVTVVSSTPSYPIGTVTTDTDGNGQVDSVGVECSLTGVVYGIDLDGNNGISFTIIDNAGDGINVFNFNDVDAYVVTEGDEITVTGTIGSFNGLGQIFADAITLNSPGNALLPPNVVATLDETTESQLIKMNNMTLVDPAQWDNMGSNNIDITDGTNTFRMRLDSDVALNDEPAPTGAFNITGIGGQFDTDSSWVDGYQILPRFVSDLELVTTGGGPALMIIGVADPQPGNGMGSATAGAKTVQLYALQDIPDLSIYGVGVANNGSGTDGVEFTFPPDAISAGTCITYTDSINEQRFIEFFGVAPDYIVPSGGSSAAGVNGDDAVELFQDSVVIDTYGDINVLGDGEVWDYTDGWAYRINGTGPDGGTFVPGNWIYSGVDALQSATLTMNSEFTNPFPFCTYLFMVPDIEAMDDEVNVPMDVASNINILGNDITAIGVNSLTIISGPTNGTAMANGTVDIIYTPNMGSCSADSLTYEICDDNGCSQATVSIEIYCSYTIGLVTGDSDGNGVGDSVGVAVELTAVVYGIDLQGTNDNLQFTLIDTANDGIGVFASNYPGYIVTEGDEITVWGTVSHFNGLTQINPDIIAFNSPGNTLVTPTDVTALDESTESQLVRITNLSLVNPADWDTGSSFNIDVTDGTNTYAVRLDSDVDLASQPAPTTLFNLTGIGGQFDSSDPHTDGYQLLPRYIADLDIIEATNDLGLGNKIQFMPNPTSDILNIRSEIQLDEIRIYNTLGQNMVNLISPDRNDSVNVNNWQSGVYVITFISEDRIYTSQFVKQ